MGEVKRVLITGASGFIGRATVRAALAAGLDVVAVQRKNGDVASGVTVANVDLTRPDAVPLLNDALAGCDAVIHLAAAMSGNPDDHRHLTIGGTERLLSAMTQAGVGHLTLASSIAVFDTIQVPIGGDLTDDCPLENPAMSRDAYSGAKVRQEKIARSARLNSLAILRPGIVYDEDHLWNAHLGVGVGPALIRIGDDSTIPMCHVDRCATALVYATVHRVSGSRTVMDTHLPTRGNVIAHLKRSGWPKLVVPLPWQLLLTAARAMRPFSGKMPGLLRESVLRQRALPMGYDLEAVFGADTLPNPALHWGGHQ